MNILTLPSLPTLQQLLPPRAIDAQKGDFGTVLIIGGDEGMGGAPLMAGMAAQRTGAGKVIIATHPNHAFCLVNNWPSLIAHSVNDASALSSLLAQATQVVIGPGLGQSAWGKTLWMQALKTSLPLLLDADALNLLSHNVQKQDNWILTPHPGEAAHLLHCAVADIQQDRPVAARQLQQKYGGYIVLKGAQTLIADAENIWVCEAGNPGMASAGMGDLLTGVITGLMGQGLSPLQAAQLGVSIHAHAGDLAAQQGQRGMVPMDLLPFIRKLVSL
ncbi:MAG: NAD(P)H-hydrate dehydratase [Legionellales bacterium]